jgi:putative tricarboxylic transport membrane protein
MRALNWALAPLVLAFVLGPMIERSGRQVLGVSPELLLTRPVFWLFIPLGAVIIWVSRRLTIRGEIDD